MRHEDREARRCTQSLAGLSVLGLSKTRVCRIARWILRLKAQTHKTRLAGTKTDVKRAGTRHAKSHFHQEMTRNGARGWSDDDDSDVNTYLVVGRSTIVDAGAHAAGSPGRDNASSDRSSLILLHRPGKVKTC